MPLRSRVSMMAVCAAMMVFTALAQAEHFGIGENQFDIDFVTISGSTNPTIGYFIVNYDYSIGMYEITNDQWDKFKANLGVPVTGDPSTAYDEAPLWTGANEPTNEVSWYEAAQFVNWLNTSKGHQAAYKFTGTQGTSNYTFAPWSPSDGGYDANNPFRNSNAVYFLPTEDEWVKAAYWNGTTLQGYATTDGSVPTAGVDSNYGQAFPYTGPWAVGSGSEELNGTYDMMGNVEEWMESPRYNDPDYGASSFRGLRGGSLYSPSDSLTTFHLNYATPTLEGDGLGFRVASNAVIPAPPTLVGLLGMGLMGALGYVWRRRRKR